MKSLPILTLAALAVFVPGAHASGAEIEKIKDDPKSLVPDPPFDISPALIPEIQHKVLRELTAEEANNYSLVNVLYNRIAKEFRPSLRVDKALKMMKLFGKVNKKNNFEIRQALGMLFQQSGNKQSVPLGAIIHLIGPNELLKNRRMANELASVSVRSRLRNAKAPVVNDVVVTADPHSLFQLCKAVWPQEHIIEELIIQNAAQFSNGLVIDKKWDEDLVKWFTKSFVTRFGQSHPVIQYSHDDISSMLASIVYSHPKLQQLSPRPSLTMDDLVMITEKMNRVLDVILFDYNKGNLQPPLGVLLQLKTGPLKVHPKPFDITRGFKAYLDLNPRPSVMALLNGLTSLLENQLQDFNDQISPEIAIIVSRALTIAGMNVEDMSWLIQKDIHQILMSMESDTLGMALKSMCGVSPKSTILPDCSKSIYFNTAPKNGVLGWSMQLSPIRELIKARKYTSAHLWLTKLLDFKLVPAHALEKTKNVLKIIGDTEDGSNLRGLQHTVVSKFVGGL